MSASSSSIRCSRSTFAMSSPASWCPTCRSASTRPCCAQRRSAPANAANTPSSSPGRCRHRRSMTSILADLVAFFKDPVKGFFRALEFTLPRDVDGVQDAMPVDINALEEWTVGDRMLGDILRGMTADRRAPGGVASRHAAARPAGLAQGGRDSRSGRPAGDRSTTTSLGERAGLRRRHPSRWRSTAHRHGIARCSASAWCR